MPPADHVRRRLPARAFPRLSLGMFSHRLAIHKTPTAAAGLSRQRVGAQPASLGDRRAGRTPTCPGTGAQLGFQGEDGGRAAMGQRRLYA